MKLRNKKTGEIREARIFGEHLQLWAEALNDWMDYDDLDYLTKYWERYEEPKKHYFTIDDDGVLVCRTAGDFLNEGLCKQIGNYFESKEEAEQAIEKLKAWKRLKDKGFRFDGGDDACISYEVDIENWTMQDLQDFTVLFGGEE